MHVVSISGSPSIRSRSAWLMQLAVVRLEGLVRQSSTIAVRDLPPAALMAGDARHPAIAEAADTLSRAGLVIVSTPIYKGAYSGLLKAFLDLLPAEALRGKTVLPLATGGSPGHLLAIDYALKPVLGALGARDILDGVFATDAQLVALDSGGYVPDPAVVDRIDRVLAPLGVGDTTDRSALSIGG